MSGQTEIQQALPIPVKTRKTTDPDRSPEAIRRSLQSYITRFGIEFMIAVFLGWGIELTFCLTAWKDFSGGLSAFCILWFGSGAAFYTGTMMGFIFGIPKARTSSQSAKQIDDYGDNTNLEEVSDWLTKIIIGVGLIEFEQIRKLLVSMGEYMGAAMGGNAGAAAVATCSIVYGFVCGFLCYYVWARTRLSEEFRGGKDR